MRLLSRLMLLLLMLVLVLVLFFFSRRIRHTIWNCDWSSDVCSSDLVDHGACILCDRCIRGCNDIRNNQVIGRMGKGYKAQIAFDLNAPMGNSSCVACGECSVSCPTGALTTREIVEANPWKDVVPAPDPVEPRELYEHPIPDIKRAFEGMSHVFLRWNSRAIVRRHYKKGEIICREGEFGSTAYFIEDGSVE